jgi:ribonucleotide reductase beta subunit family protein with ferritin-like domain
LKLHERRITLPTADDYEQTPNGRWKLKRKEEDAPYISQKEEREVASDKPIYVAKFDGLVDIVDNAGDLVYLVKEQGELKVVPSVEKDTHKCLLPPRDQLPYSIPRWSEVQKACKEDDQEMLFRDLVAYHKKFSELPNDGYYVLLAAWDFSTYILEALQYSGYIYLYAVPERGKTKTGQAIIYVAYRGIHQGNLREADLFRASEDLGATLFLDVLSLWKRAQREGSEDILLQRYEKGARVRRVLNPERGAFKDSRYYGVYGATVIASNEAISHILESRSFPVDMPYSPKNFPKPTPEAGLPLRERLVAWRARHLGLELPAPKELTLGRLNDITTPLWQIINLVSPSHLMLFEELIQEFSEKRREEKAVSIEGEVIKALLDLENEGKDGKLLVSMITDKVNEKRRDRDKVSSIYIGKVLRRLNFKLAGSHKEKRSYIYDTGLIQRLSIEYGLADTYTPSDYPSQASQVSPQIDNTSVEGDGWDGKDTYTEGAYSARADTNLVPCLSNGRVVNWQWCQSTWDRLGRPVIHAGDNDNIFDLSPILYPERLSPKRLEGIVSWLENHSGEKMHETSP